MFESGSSLEVAALRALPGALAGLQQEVGDAVRIDRIRALEELKSAVAAAQAKETAALAAAQQREQSARSIAGQVGLARRISPWQAGRYVGWAGVLVRELPHTFTALQQGRISEWRAIIIARETTWLSRRHRAMVDRELAPKLQNLGDRQLEAEAKKIAYRLDPAGFVARVRGAESDRRTTLRPAPEAMGRLAIFAPIAQAVAAHLSLGRDADAAIHAGDPRSRGQLMTDLAIQRLTGQPRAAAVPVEIDLVMTDHTLLNPDVPEPAVIAGYGPIPAGIARALALDETGTDAPRWLRRIFRKSDTGELAAMDSRRRAFSTTQRHFITLRDQHCRTPYCGAPIRDTDHITPAEVGGPTSIDNGQGYCEACNYTKQAPGWITRLLPGDRHQVEITTPTGHHYRSPPLDPPGRPQTPLEQQAVELLRRAVA